MNVNEINFQLCPVSSHKGWEQQTKSLSKLLRVLSILIFSAGKHTPNQLHACMKALSFAPGRCVHKMQLLQTQEGYGTPTEKGAPCP